MTTDTQKRSLSIVIPAKNEAAAIGDVVKRAKEAFPDAELIVVDDGSEDETGSLAELAGATVRRHPVSLGNGAAVKSGARAATGELIAFMDADGQHSADDLAALLDRMGEGFDMVVGARNAGGHANVGRLFANGLYNQIATAMSGQPLREHETGKVARRYRTWCAMKMGSGSWTSTCASSWTK